MMKTDLAGSVKKRVKEWFDTPLHCLFTLIIALLVWKAGVPFLKWAIFNANWGFVRENLRFILFGFYPPQEQWRPLVAMVLLGVTGAVTVQARLSCKALAGMWAGFCIMAAFLLYGGFSLLVPVESARFSGLPLTLILSVTGIAVSYPLGILLALGRNSRAPVLGGVTLVYIEIFQGVPLISLLFVSSMLFPLFLPEGVSVSKLLRAETAIILSSSAYIAEAVRGGLRAVEKGQYEAAKATGMNRIGTLWYVILPQALPIAMPATVNRFITLFKDTSLVIVVALFDLLKTSQTPLANPKWMGASAEAYLFAAMIYFCFCFTLSRVGKRFEM
ncbi:MAG: amino acid ABC transporter permease [Desulfobacterium sp.]|nr:amino acid ABC transporter permease [Desulfobacterium sp.]